MGHALVGKRGRVMTMSDCSLHAFDTPDEHLIEGQNQPIMSDKQFSGTPKTCGNCAKGTRYVQCCDNAELYGEGCSCDKHVPRSDTLEQRYQQLEQVAENLFHSFCFYCKHDEIIKSYRTLLEDLGVSLDD